MTREFCDRCGKDRTGLTSSAIHGIRDAASNGDGTITDNFDILCPRCYRAIITFIRTAPTKKRA